jgi:hypothetical protein
MSEDQTIERKPVVLIDKTEKTPVDQMKRLSLLPVLVSNSCCFTFRAQLGLNGNQVKVMNETQHACHIILRPMKGCRVVTSDDVTYQASLAADGVATGQMNLNKKYALIGQIAENQCFHIPALSPVCCNLPMGVEKEVATLFVLWEGIPPGNQDVQNLELASSSYFEVLGGQKVLIVSA